MSAELLERRRAAIATSGWGARFDFFQPHNACLWVYLGLVVSGLWFVVNTVKGTGGAFDEAYATALVSSALFAAAFLAFLRHADRWERTPPALALAAFLGGGFGATFAIAIVGNGALMSIYTKVFGEAWATVWEAGLTAPFVEETSKGAIFVLLLGLAPVVIRTASDGLMVGAYVGLGFQIVEDILYAQNSAFAEFGAHQSDAVLHTFLLRAVTGIPSHALYTALFGAGVIYALGTPAQPRRLARGIALMLSAMLIHGVRPGPMIMTEAPTFVYDVVAMMMYATIGILIYGLTLTNLLIKVLMVPKAVILPIIFVLCVVGSYAIASRLFDVWVMLGFGVLGYVLRRFKYPVAPLVLGMVLGDLMEKGLRRGLVLSDGSLEPFFTRPISAVLWVTIVLVIVMKLDFVRNLFRRTRTAT